MKNIILLLAGLAYFTIAFAQAPASFKYQAVARDGSGAVLANKSVSFRISIQQGSVTGAIVYSELHYTSTNEFGLVNLEIGKGSVISGNFAGISWGSDAHYIKVDMDPNGVGDFVWLGTTQLLSVPYALHAKTVESGDKWGSQFVITDLTMSGNGTSSFPLAVAQRGATVGQILKWNGTTWIPAADEIGTGGGTPTGPAGGDLAGTYPNPIIGAGKVSSLSIRDATIISEDLADNAIISSKIADLSVGTNDLANGSVTTAKISGLGAGADQVLQFNGASVAWGYAPGSEINVQVFSVSCVNVASFGVTYVKIADFGTVTKLDGTSKLEVTFQGRVNAYSLTGTGAHFELRMDDAPTTVGRARANIKAAEAGSDGMPVTFTGIFTGLRAGSHTVSMWVRASNGTGTYGGVDPGCWTDDVIIVREIK